MWLNRNVWVLWNDIGRCPHEIQAEWVSVLESKLVAKRDLVSHGCTSKWRNRRSAKRVREDNTIWSREEVVRDQYSSSYLSPSAHLSLSHYRNFNSKKNKELYFCKDVSCLHLHACSSFISLSRWHGYITRSHNALPKTKMFSYAFLSGEA